MDKADRMLYNFVQLIFNYALFQGVVFHFSWDFIFCLRLFTLFLFYAFKMPMWIYWKENNTRACVCVCKIASLAKERTA